MTGAVLCGGQSTRMGSDKGLLKLHAGTWAQTAIEKLEKIGLPVILSINAKQQSDYQAVFPHRKLVTDQEDLAIKGPLAGIMSLHLAYPGEDLFVLACDLPLMDPRLLHDLLQCAPSGLSHHAYVYQNGTELEPLCGIYTAKALDKIYQLYNDNLLLRHSMKFMLSQLDVFTLPVKEPDQQAFRNFNAHAELNGL